MFETPILFLIFNRPETTARVFSEIRKLQPKYLFIAADGPRPKKEGEVSKCDQARKIVADIDWPCEVQHLYRNFNLGCGIAVSEAISWFFSKVEMGIILEDDCLPDQSFFSFCEEMLTKFAHKEDIMHIGGSSFVSNEMRDSYPFSYYFSAYPLIWGWATWRRAWQQYQFNVQDIVLADHQLFKEKEQNRYWKGTVANFQKKPLDTWDVQWTICLWKNHGKSITPIQNLVNNIGFGVEATHTKESVGFLIRKSGMLSFPVTHPNSNEVAEPFDYYFFKNTHDHWRPKSSFGALTDQIQYYLKRIRGIFKK